MDRRKALKKMAAGGAIAAGGSVVLSSNNVAFAASHATVTGIPADGAPLPITYATVPPTPSRARIIDATTPGCSDGSPVTTTHSWQIYAYSLTRPGRKRRFRMWNSDESVRIDQGPKKTPSCGPNCRQYVGPGSFTGITLGKKGSGNKANLHNGDTYEIHTLITWSCPGQTIEAEYAIVGTFPNTPTAVNLSYTVT